jgi:UDP-glucose 4-epimerase
MSPALGSVMITGSTTPFGLALVRRLLDDGYEVLAVGREDVYPWTHHNLSYHRCDLTRGRAVRKLLYGPAATFGVRTLVHAALHRSADAGSRIHRLNVGATRLLLALSHEHPTLKRFIFQSNASVYKVSALVPDVIAEDQPLNVCGDAPQWIGDRVEADVAVCGRMGLSNQRITVLRCAEMYGPDLGSQLWDYVHSRYCLRPVGYDPMINLLSIEDAVDAFATAVHTDVQGVFNVPGYDTLPLSRLIRLAGCMDVTLPGPLLGPLYRLRAVVRHTEFRYALNRWRFHFNGILCGRRARAELGYVPKHPLLWR